MAMAEAGMEAGEACLSLVVAAAVVVVVVIAGVETAVTIPYVEGRRELGAGWWVVDGSRMNQIEYSCATSGCYAQVELAMNEYRDEPLAHVELTSFFSYMYIFCG